MNILDMGLANYREQIEEISKKAEKQWSLEKKLNGIVEILKNLKVDSLRYKNTGTFVLKGVDETQQILDDQLNILLMMKASPHIKPVLAKATVVETKIILIQDTLDGWIKTQRGWMYLEPIFSSEDIKQKMQVEKAKFDIVDKNWRSTMEFFSKEPNLWENVES
jgi:dynein heavy chain